MPVIANCSVITCVRARALSSRPTSPRELVQDAPDRRCDHHTSPSTSSFAFRTGFSRAVRKVGRRRGRGAAAGRGARGGRRPSAPPRGYRSCAAHTGEHVSGAPGRVCGLWRTSSSSSICLTSRTVCVVEKNWSLKHMFPTRMASRSSAQHQGAMLSNRTTATCTREKKRRRVRRTEAHALLSFVGLWRATGREQRDTHDHSNE
jgi:hypothetical protein